MANQEDIKKYLLSGSNSYFEQDNRNGEILMLSGVWGSGKTHFWKKIVEDKIIERLEKKNKSYVFVSLYGVDSVNELKSKIYQASYDFSIKNKNKSISKIFLVFKKIFDYISKISIFGVDLPLKDIAEQAAIDNIKLQIKAGTDKLKDGGIICFDDFERKSSKMDLNDLFGFITNFTEVSQTKTIIITNQEFFKENDSEVFSRIKEKSVNKFLLLNPTVDELFETIYKEKYTELDEYKNKILEAIKITKEKNARIFIQVLDNCLEYKENAENEHNIFMLVLITVLFVKYNLIFGIEIKIIKSSASWIEIKKEILSKITKKIPPIVLGTIIKNKLKGAVEENYINLLKFEIEQGYNKPSENLKNDFKYIENNKEVIYQYYKYFIENQYFKEEDQELIEKLNNFVESGILK